MKLPHLRWPVAWIIWTALACRIAAVPDWLQPCLQTKVEPTEHPAVILLRTGDVRFIAADRVRKTYRGAMRIVSEHGRGRALALQVINPDVETIISAQAWVIAPDGRKSEAFSTSKFADVPLPVGPYFWLQHRLISFSAGDKINAGGVFAWEFQIQSKTGISDVHWSFDTDLPAQRMVFEVTPPAGGRIEWYSASEHLPAPLPGVAAGALRWEVGAIVPPKGALPDAFLPEPQSLFTRAVPAQDAGGSRTWRDFAKLAADVIEPRLTLSAEVKARAEAIAAGHSTRWKKIRALGEWVQRDITYLSVALDRDYLAGYRPRPVDEVLKNRFGDCKDKMALLIAMLRAIGEQGFPVMVAAGNPTLVRKEWPAAVFNHVIVGISSDDTVPAEWPVIDAGELGRLVLFDPTDRVTPLGFLPGSDQAGYGLVASPVTNELVALPVTAETANRYHCRVDASLDDQGNLSVKAEESLDGLPAVQAQAARQQLNPEQAKRAIESRLREGSLAVKNLQWTDSWDPATAHASLKINFTAERYARRTGTLQMLSPQVLFARARLNIWQTNQPGLVWTAANIAEKEVRITLPAGSVIEEIPEDYVSEFAGATGRLSYRHEGDVIVYRYESKQRGGLLPRASYEETREFLQKMHEAERRPIVLRWSPVPAATTAREIK